MGKVAAFIDRDCVITGYGCNDGFKDATPDIKVKNLFAAAKIIVGEK